MFIASVATVSLAVFTDLSIMELDNAKLVLVHDRDPAIQTVAVPAAIEPADDTQDQGDATASIWAKGAVKKHRTRN
jgi:hypothetical protein